MEVCSDMAFGWPGMASWGAAWPPYGAWVAPGGKAKGWGAKGFPGAGFPGGGFAPACVTKYGPVANVCKSAVPTTQTVPLAVTKLVPVSTITPVPGQVAPQTSFGKPIPVGATKVPTGCYAKGVPGFGKGVPWGYGKGAPVGYEKGVGGYGKGAPGGYGKGVPGGYDKVGPGGSGKGLPGGYGKGAPWGAFGKAGPMVDGLEALG
jgi:hypothetical protein